MEREMEIISRSGAIHPSDLEFWKVERAALDFNARLRGMGRRIQVAVKAGRDGYVIRTNRPGSRAANVATGQEVLSFFRGVERGISRDGWTDLAVRENAGGWAVVEACPDVVNACEEYAVSEFRERMDAWAAGCRATRRLH